MTNRWRVEPLSKGWGGGAAVGGAAPAKLTGPQRTRADSAAAGWRHRRRPPQAVPPANAAEPSGGCVPPADQPQGPPFTGAGFVVLGRPQPTQKIDVSQSPDAHSPHIKTETGGGPRHG